MANLDDARRETLDICPAERYIDGQGSVTHQACKQKNKALASRLGSDMLDLTVWSYVNSRQSSMT